MENKDRQITVRQTFHNSPEVLFTNYLLMKLGGQVEISYEDLSAMTHTYQSHEVVLDHENHRITLTLRTRPEEYPRPELPPDRTRS